MQVNQVYEQAHQAGLNAVLSANVTPMIVTERANPLDDSSSVKRAYFVDDGVCGFASVIVKPANCKFAKYLQAQGLGRKHYYGGMSMSVRDFNQSLTKKEAYAEGFAKVLRDNGINAWAESRMD
jgi:hypothetical protein